MLRTMTYTAEWYLPGHIYMVSLTGELTLEDIGAFDKAFWQASEAGNPPIHLILECSRVTKFPLNIDQIYRVVTKDDSDIVGWVVLVTSNSVSEFVSSNVMKLMHKRFRGARTLEDALRFLTQVDDSLDPM